MANPFVVGIVSLVIATIMVVNVLVPIVKGGNTASFTTAELAIYSMITLGALIGLGYSSFSIFGLA